MAQAQRIQAARDTATRVTITPRAKQVRNAMRLGGERINDDFRYLNQQELSQNASNDEIFNAKYQKSGLQPTTNDQKRTEKASNDVSYVEESYTQNSGAQPAVTVKERLKKPSTASKLRGKLKATANNITIMTWGTTIWLSFQLPIAILSIAMFGMTGAANAAANSNGFISIAVWIASQVASGINAISGFNLNLLSMAEDLFLLSYVLVLAIGILTILTAYLQYTLSFLRPLSGEMAGLKIGTLLLVIAGYSIPLLNIFPWILLWMAVVWKYPK